MKKIVISILLILLVGIIIIFIINIDNTKAVPTTLADEVVSLSQGTSWSSGANGVYQTNNHEYRYVGGNVNNWVSFNNDMYRIIGVFDSNSTGVNDYLVKLIRSRMIGAFTWGITNQSPNYTEYLNYSCNWETANANIILNEYYLNATDTSSKYGSCSSNWSYFYTEYQYNVRTNHKYGNCDNIVRYGIKNSNLRNYIQPVTWYLKGYDSTLYSKQNFYTCERSDTTTITNCKSGNSGAYTTKVTNKSIGLMYPSDYLYASGYYASDDTTTSGQKRYGQQNWLYVGNEWMITPTSHSNNYAFFVSSGSIGYSTYVIYPYALRPTFYLKEQVYVTGGDGSFHNPYTIACDTCNS